ncbi:glutathione S-transferase [Nitrospirillum amazonense]|uniref:Glutathione S-transferase n=1 Tax=Nitrospirillum amazonense TaxID=28077 RepID=A0A560FM94_9PROT|nr:glutathione S-transferase family protein [Nitrospirillum amazonense]TWB22736.1 glutathione S-transferase [Nitrospirillum amazonense]
MRTLVHHPLSPFARKVRVVLAEKRLEVDLEVEKPWERREEFLALNPAGELPVLVEDDGATVVEHAAICNYLEEAYPHAPTLLGREVLLRAEVRRLAAWFDVKFNQEVTENLVGEKLIKRFSGSGTPHAQAIRAGLANIHYHLDYIAYLADRRKWLAGDDFSLADIAAAAHLSTIDYLGDVPWDQHPEAKDWYMRIKCRPSFRPLLGDHLPGAPPPKHYADLDF